MLTRTSTQETKNKSEELEIKPCFTTPTLALRSISQQSLRSPLDRSIESETSQFRYPTVLNTPISSEHLDVTQFNASKLKTRKKKMSPKYLLFR